jgi:nucleotide-binding universal stress UspA family protein
VVKTILVPHDGGPMSDDALKYALEIAKSMDKIMLARIIPEMLDIAAMSFWTETERRRVRKEVRIMRRKTHESEYTKLQKQISLINSRGVKGSAFVTEGTNIAEKILQQIKKEKPYLVVVGSKRLKQRGRLSKIQFLGSVARKLAEQSPTPILIVK